MKNLNLVRTSRMWNPLTAITEKGQAFELDNIIIYSENGVLIETDRGWFGSGNNEIEEGVKIFPEIKRKLKIDFTKKENYVIKSEPKDYRIEQHYTLYLYYKNVNYNFEGLTLDNLFLNLNYNILNGTIKTYMVIGDRDKKSHKIEYTEELQEAFEKIDHYNFTYHSDEFLKATKTLQKYLKKYEKAKEYEKTLTVDNYNELLRKDCINVLENNQKIKQ